MDNFWLSPGIRQKRTIGSGIYSVTLFHAGASDTSLAPAFLLDKRRSCVRRCNVPRSSPVHQQGDSAILWTEGGMEMRRSVSVLGGDPRQLCLAELFREEGHRVHTWGLAPPETELPLPEAASGDVVVLPQPLSPDGVHLSLRRGELLLEDLWPLLAGPGRTVLGGRVDPAAAASAQAAGVELIDYFRREELQVANAVTTA